MLAPYVKFEVSPSATTKSNPSKGYRINNVIVKNYLTIYCKRVSRRSVK